MQNERVGDPGALRPRVRNEPPSGRRKKIALRVVFAAAILLLPLELVIQKLEGHQPYPGIYQPSFADTPLKGSTLSAALPVVHVTFADGSVEEVPYESVLPDSKLLDLSVFKSAFYTQSRASDPATVVWLRADLESKFPGKQPTQMVVDWTNEKIDINDPVQRTGTITRTITVDLKGN